MKCIDCGYYYADEDDVDFVYCHFTGPIGWAPCEDEEDEVEDYEEEAEYE